MVNKNYLKLENIFFSYNKEKNILKNLNAKLTSGKIIALLGINGSGKTTLFKILTGIIRASHGYLKYNDTTIDSKNIIEYKSKIGFMPEFLQLYKNLSVEYVISLLSNLKGYENNNIDEILDTVFLLEHKKKKIKDLSKGMKQRLNLAQAIIGNPKIIIFDEPSNGFDCSSISMFYKILRKLADNNSIVIISSHHLTEIEGNVDSVLILSDGKIIKELSLLDLNNNQEYYKEIKILTKNEITNNIKKELSKSFNNIIYNENSFTVNLNSKLTINLIINLIQLNIEIIDIKITNKTIENILKNLK